jgi:hypothetical protein
LIGAASTAGKAEGPDPALGVGAATLGRPLSFELTKKQRRKRFDNIMVDGIGTTGAQGRLIATCAVAVLIAGHSARSLPRRRTRPVDEPAIVSLPAPPPVRV